MSSPNIAPRQAKYSATNPVARYAVISFFRVVEELVSELNVKTLLDAGCGEGEVLARLTGWTDSQLVGIDLDPQRIELASATGASNRLIVADVLSLPFRSESFDLVLLLEVLEHLPDPSRALREAHRVSRRHLLASVPHEPWWRIGNVARLNYLRAFCNTPEHIQHWSHRGFKSLVAEQFSIVATRLPFLWQFVLAIKRP